MKIINNATTAILSGFLKQKSFSLQSEGNSMFPILRSGDVVEYSTCSFLTLKINDIVLIKKKGVMIAHRVIYKHPSYVITKGDNNLLHDGNIYPNKVIAKAVQVKRNNKKLSKLKRNLNHSILKH